MAEIPETEDAAQALRESEARARAILDAAVDAIITIDEQGTIESVNPAVEKLFGYPASEIIGRNVRILTSNPYREERDDDLRSDVETDRNKTIGVGREVVGRRKDGTTFPMQLAVSEMRLGERRMFTGIARDITDLKSVIERLEDSEARTRAILDTAVDAILTIDEEGSIESLNPAAERLFGYAAPQLIGRNIKMLMPSPYREEHDTYLSNYLATGRKKIIGIGREVVGLRSDGTSFPMELAVSEVRLAARRFFTGVVRDIGERKRAEERLRFYAAELQQSNAELLRSNQELDDFAYAASHDLKEPLRGIHNYATCLLEDYADRLDVEARTKLETLKALSRRMDDLIDSLLEFSRVGRLDFSIRETDLNQVLQEVLQALQVAIRERSVVVRVPHPLPVVRCDRVRVAEAFQNLISNAIKYSDKPEPWVEVGVRDSAGDSAAATPATVDPAAPEATVFYVRDNGIGIRPNHVEAIFRIFKRLHARDRFGGGAGVGLTIVKKIVERHGGWIRVESTPGQGTTFFFTLAARGDSP